MAGWHTTICLGEWGQSLEHLESLKSENVDVLARCTQFSSQWILYETQRLVIMITISSYSVYILYYTNSVHILVFDFVEVNINTVATAVNQYSLECFALTSTFMHPVSFGHLLLCDFNAVSLYLKYFAARLDKWMPHVVSHFIDSDLRCLFAGHKKRVQKVTRCSGR